MSIFDKTGKMALGSRLRMMSSAMTDDAAKIYEMNSIHFSPKWFPVFFLLSEDGAKSVTELAGEVEHSQPSITKMVKEMINVELIQEKQTGDKRKTVVELTEKGKAVAQEIRVLCSDVDLAVEGLIAESTHNLWEALAEWEFLLEQKSLLHRVREQKKSRESKAVQIVPYEPKYRSIYKSLNVEWISAHFEMEKADHEALGDPEEYILNKGGMIFVALYNNEPLGVCALIKSKHPEFGYELAKMAVSPKAQGKNIGWLLATTALRAAREAGSSKVYLESNTRLKAAINLYQKLGFQKVTGLPSPYKRVNIQMEISLNKID